MSSTCNAFTAGNDTLEFIDNSQYVPILAHNAIRRYIQVMRREQKYHQKHIDIAGFIGSTLPRKIGETNLPNMYNIRCETCTIRKAERVGPAGAYEFHWLNRSRVTITTPTINIETIQLKSVVVHNGNALWLTALRRQT